MKTDKELPLIERSAIGFAYHRIICDGDGVPVDYEFLNVNPAFERYMGLPADQIIGKLASELIEDFYDSSFNRAKAYGQVALNGTEVELEQYSRPFDKYVHIEAFSMEKGYFSMLVYDISKFIQKIDAAVSERIKALEELEQSERSKAVLLANLPGMAYRCKDDEDWTMEFVSNGCHELTGYMPESLLGNRDLSFNEIIDPDYRQELRAHWDKVLQTGEKFKHEYPIISATGVARWVLEQGQVIYDVNGRVEALEGLIIDITDQKLQQQEIEYLNWHDNLTGLHNRIYYEVAKQLFDNEESLPLSIIVGDVDGLKNINAEHGMATGDRILVRIGQIMSQHKGESHVLARTGGDTFSMILPNTSSDEAYSIMQEIVLSLEVHFSSGTMEEANVHLSLGFGTRTDMEQDIGTTEDMAEEYMKMRKLLEQSSYQSTIIELFKVSMYERSREMEEHAERLADLARGIGEKLDMTQRELDELELLATLHDIGKMGIDNRILDKPGPLTPEEWEEMRKHPEIGYRIAIANPGLEAVAEYILSHHERWDGAGYPKGLAGEEIPMHSRILCIVDSYDAMTTDRVYRKAMSQEEAMAEIEKNAGTQFDPYLAHVLIKYLTNLNKSKVD